VLSDFLATTESGLQAKYELRAHTMMLTRTEEEGEISAIGKPAAVIASRSAWRLLCPRKKATTTQSGITRSK